MRTILYFLVVAGLILLVSNINSFGINFDLGITLNNGFTSALIFSLALTVVNTVLGGILRLVGFPINFMTFGLFSLVVTFAMIWLTVRIYEGISLAPFPDCIPAYLIIAIIPAVVGFFIKPFFK